VDQRLSHLGKEASEFRSLRYRHPGSDGQKLIGIGAVTLIRI